MGDERISDTPNAPDRGCPACQGLTTATPGVPCPACGKRYVVVAPTVWPSIEMREASPIGEPAWWAMATASVLVAAVGMYLTPRGAESESALVFLAIPPTVRAMRRVWMGPAYAKAHPTSYLVLAFLVSYLISFAAAAFSVVAVYVVCVSFNTYSPDASFWAMCGTFFVLHLLFWPRRRRHREPAHPPGDPEN